MNYYLSLEQSNNLLKLGFKSDYSTGYDESDYYAYKDEVWVLGGCYFNPKHKGFFAPDYVWKEGERLVTADDLLEWISNRISYEITKNKDQLWYGYLFAVDGKRIEVSADTLLDVLYELTRVALEIQPSLNDYETGPSYERIAIK